MIRQSNKMAAIVDLAELTIGKLSETLNVPPVPPITSYLFSTVFRFSSGSSVLSSHFHPTLQTKDFLIFAYFLCLKERNGTSLKMQDFIISDIAKLNR